MLQFEFIIIRFIIGYHLYIYIYTDKKLYSLLFIIKLYILYYFKLQEEEKETLYKVTTNKV